MTSKTKPIAHDYVARYETFEAERRSQGDPAWLATRRADGLSAFHALGFPTRRHEDWRFTNVAPIADGPFTRAPARPVDTRDVARASMALGDAHRLVFIDGRYAPALSNPRAEALPPGTIATSFALATKAHSARLEAHLAAHADARSDAFLALNTAMIEDGCFIDVPKNAVVTHPIHVVWVSTGRDGEAAFPRCLALAGEHAQLTLVQEYVDLAAGRHFTCAATEVVMGAGSKVVSYLVEREGMRGFHIHSQRIDQGRDTDFASHSAMLGGLLARSTMNPVLAGEGGTSMLNGIYVLSGEQHVDNFMRVEHDLPHCSSRQYYKGILDGKAHGVFSGRIIVARGAQKTDAIQNNQNLLLSEQAQADTKPQLEIYADDVRCTHGAIIGKVDANALYYLMSRGIDRATARAILIHAYARESLERMALAPVREFLETEILARLGQTAILERSTTT